VAKLLLCLGLDNLASLGALEYGEVNHIDCLCGLVL
jgi:hypothetical protein